MSVDDRALGPTDAGVRAGLLAVGARDDDGGARAIGAIRQLAELLLGAGEPWRVRRLAPGAGPAAVPDRLNLKRELDDLGAHQVDQHQIARTRSPVSGEGPVGGMTPMGEGLCESPSVELAPVALVVIAGALVVAGGAPALQVGPAPRRYPDESTLPLPWIVARVAAARAERRVLVLAVRGDRALAAACAALVATVPAALTVVAVADADDPDDTGDDDALAAVATALAGAALDPTTGTVTHASLGRYLAAALPAAVVGPCDHRATLLTPPPLGRIDELLWSRRTLAAAAAVPVPAVAVADRLGTVLPGRFRLEAALARGSFGTVYRAQQLAIGREVAVKILHDEIDPTSADGRLFLQEIHAVGRIDHPNVVRIYQADVGHDGRLFYAMELLPGRTLLELATAARLPIARAVALVGQLLAGLGAAHDAGLVHADVKPANAIVVDGRGGERVVLVDFGLARLRRAGEPLDSAGGTPAYMAPEQLRDGRVDARSDLFSAALVLVNLITGWRRRRASELTPPLDDIADPALRATLARALALEPGERFATAAALAAALRGEADPTAPAETRPPFRRLASFTEADRDRLFGRARDLAALTDHALFRPAVVLTAPSGTGKTSLLRAGLVPHLGRLGAQVVYASSRTAAVPTLIAALAPDAPDLATAIATARRRQPTRLVLVIDQLEHLLDDAAPADDPLAALFGFERWLDADVGLVLAVREDFLARLLARRELASAGVPIVRLGPLDLAAARDALVQPLAERRIAIAPELLERLLADLAAAAAALAPELGWPATPAVYPPHLQLAGAVLYDALGADEAILTVGHYQRLGGLEAIIGEHLERVLDTELDPTGAAIARGLFLALVTSTHARAARTEAELLDMSAGPRADGLAVLEVLRGQGLLVRTQRAAGEPVWELVHDSLVPRIQGWIDRHDLARRGAIEQVRYHLRRSRVGPPSLLARTELRELDSHPGALAELEAEHTRRGGAAAWSPARLVARSRQVRRRTLGAALTLATVVAAAVAIAAYDRIATAATARRERSLSERDLGRFVLALRPFAWAPGGDPGAIVDVDAGALPGLSWTLHDPDPDDPTAPGATVPPGRVFVATAFTDPPGHYRVEAPGGAAVLVVDGRAGPGEPPCPPSVIPLRALPGYRRRGQSPPTLAIRVPTCGASAAGLIDIPAGPFIDGGPGEPPSQLQLAYDKHEQRTELPAFRLDRTEVTNGAYGVLAAMAELTGIAAPIYPESNELALAGSAERPVAGVGWDEATAYCRFLGKRLPTSAESQKATRGGLTLADGLPNPMPRRNLPWGAPLPPFVATGVFANINDGIDTGPRPVATSPGDRSPDGILDLAGNVAEWTSTLHGDHFRRVHGGNWAETTPADLIDYMAIENRRAARETSFFLGLRCAADGRAR